MIALAQFDLQVSTDQLTFILRKVCREELHAKLLRLSFEAGHLGILAGRTSCRIPAIGSWPARIAVQRSWALETSRYPVDDFVTELQVREGYLYTGGIPVPCRLVEESEPDHQTAQRRDGIAGAFQAWRDLAAVNKAGWK